MSSESYRLSYTLQGKPLTAVVEQRRTVLGRDHNCNICIPDTVISRRHAAIEKQGDDWVLTDLGSSNGTFVNGVRIKDPIVLQDQDRIALGSSSGIVFHLSEVRERVHFSDAPLPVDPLASVNVQDVEELMSSDSSVPGAPAPPGGTTGVIGLFGQVALTLLTSEDQQKLLDKIMDLMFRNLPAERGLLCLLDEKTDTLTPKVIRGGRPEETFTISRSIKNQVIESKQALLITDASSDARFSATASIQLSHIHSAMCAPLYHGGRVTGLVYVDTRDRLQMFTQQHLELFTTLAVLSAVGIEQARLRQDVLREQRLRDRVSRYLSPGLVEQMLQSPNANGMIAEEREVSVVFCDLCGFTSLSEDMAPAEVSATLNAIFERLSEVIFHHEGTLDKYMGDALMAVFGAPFTQPDHAQRAVQAALAIQQELRAFNAQNPARKPLELRVAINSGPVIAGDIGSPKQKDYTVIGDTVNVASRLESTVAAPGQLVIGPRTFELLQGRFPCQALTPVPLKGKKRVVQPYLVLGPAEDAGEEEEAEEWRQKTQRRPPEASAE